MGTNLESDASLLQTIYSLIKNFIVLFYLNAFNLLSSVHTIIENFDNIENLLNGVYRIAAFGSAMTSYFTLCFYKKIVNEYFNEIESIVNERIKMLKFSLYEEAIEKSNKFVKFTVLSVSIGYGFFTICSVLSTIVQGGSGSGNMDVQYWFVYSF